MAVPEWVINSLYTVVIFIVVGTIGETVIAYIHRAGTRAGSGIASVRLVRQIIRIAWISLAGIISLAVWGVTSDLLTGLVVGVLALVISLSLQSTLQNMIAGIFLLYDGAIRVGDRIEHFAIKGTVVRVALRNTWVRIESGEIAVVGNLKLADGPTLNYGLGARYATSEAQSRLPWMIGPENPGPAGQEHKTP